MTNGHFKKCKTGENCWCEIKRYGLVFLIAIVILMVEIIGGLFTHSIALLSDAGHVFTDTIATLVTIIVAYYVKNDNSHETQTRKQGGYINASLLGVMAIWIGFEAIERFYNPHEVISTWMTVFAIFGTIGNGIQHKVINLIKAKHVTHESMRLHILSDLVQSIGVVLGGGTIWATGWIWIDPLISIAVALVMLQWTYRLVKELLSGKYDNLSHCSHE